MMDRLYAQLHVWAGMQHEWSYCDCYMVLSDWVNIVTGVDPFAEIRGTYGNPAVCPIGRAYRADPIPLGDRFMADFPRVQDPRPGDIAFVEVPGQRFLCGAVRLKKGSWAMKTEGASVTVLKRVIPHRIWGIGYAA